jgi:hypothetical protein
MRRLGHPRIVLIAAVLYLFSGAAYADPIIITSGSAGLHNPGDRSGILLVGQDTRLIGDGFGFWSANVNLATNIGTGAGGFAIRDIVPFGRQQTVNGTTYDGVFLNGIIDFTFTPFAVPPPVPGDDRVFSSRFTMSGQVSGFPDANITRTPLFMVDLVGGGVVSFSGRVSPRNDGPFWNFAARPAGAAFDAVDNPAPTPEPGTILLVGSAVVGLALMQRRKKSSSATPAAE